MKKLIWLWKRFWGKKYYIVYTNNICNNEVLVYGHKIYLKKGDEYVSHQSKKRNG